MAIDLIAGVRRVLAPRLLVSIYYFLRHRAYISPRAEVDPDGSVTVGRHSRIASFVKVKASGGAVTIGSRVDVGTGAHIASGTGTIVIGDDCLISPHVCLLAANYRYDRLDVPIRDQGSTSKGIRVGANVWIGAGACVLDGVTIGDGAIVTPNAVVDAMVPANAVVHGNPAKVIFTRR